MHKINNQNNIKSTISLYKIAQDILESIYLKQNYPYPQMSAFHPIVKQCFCSLFHRYLHKLLHLKQINVIRIKQTLIYSK